MRRLADGVHALVYRPPFGLEVCSMLHPRTLTLNEEELPHVLALAHGQADSEPASEVFRRLQGIGMADEGLPAEDPVVLERLASLGESYSWQLPRGRNVPVLLDLLRRINSQRKITFELYGQTTCLPETGVARCMELTRRCGRGKRVLLVGDDDMLSVLLARMGHHVTVLEIDPLLVAFLTRVAAAEGLKITAVCQDVRDPLPSAMINSFDAVLTDPMTFEPCLVSFLSRATAALKVGGILVCALHPSGYAVFDTVCGQLPVKPVDALKGFSAYHDEGFQESWYHSDLRVLRRTQGAPPFEGHQRIPYKDIITGAHGSRWHGWRWMVASPFRRPGMTQVVDGLRAYAAALGHTGQNAEPVVDNGARMPSAFLMLDDGSHVAVTLDPRRAALCFCLYPFVTGRDALLRETMARFVPPVADGCYRCEVTPIREPVSAA